MVYGFGFCLSPDLTDYNIIYNLDGGTLDTENPLTYKTRTDNIVLNNPTKPGYTFKGWSGTDLIRDENLDVTIEKGSIGDRHYTANYIPNTYYINFNANGGTGSLSNQIMTYDLEENLNKNIFTKIGYKFLCWNTQEDGTGTSYLDEETVLNLTTESNEVVNLYAIWQVLPVRYAVQIYGINQDVDEQDNILGLTFGPATGADYNNCYVTHEYVPNEEGTYNIEIVTRTIDSSGKDEETNRAPLLDANNDNVTRTEEQVEQRQNINLHNMSWEEIVAISDKTLFEDCMLCGDTKKIDIILNDKLDSGKKFNQYGDGAGILYNNINIYYRRWNPSAEDNSYVGCEESGVELDANELANGSNARNSGGYSSSHIRATLIGENEKTNEGYAGDVNLTTDDCLYSCIESDLRDIITPKKIKYVTGTYETEGKYVTNQDIADSIWLFSEREVKGIGEHNGYEAEGVGSFGKAYDKFENEESKDYISEYIKSSTENRVTYCEPNERHYWWLRSPSLHNNYCASHVHFRGDISYGGVHAQIIGISFGFCLSPDLTDYNITYNLDGGTLDTENPLTYKTRTDNIVLNNPTKPGYTFKGWSGTDLIGDENLDVTIEKGSIGDRQYTANYIPNTYYINFNANGGTGSMSKQQMTYGVCNNLMENVFTKVGYRFIGWSLSANGTSVAYGDKEEIKDLTETNEATVNLYALWEPLATKYAVQIYGINQDVDEQDNILGLTFGPATGADYNNCYVTHEYVPNEEGTYNIEIVTKTVSSTGEEEETSREELVDSNLVTVTRTEEKVQQRRSINLHNMSWEEIATVEDKTLFEDCMLCGDTKSVELTLNDTIKASRAYNQFGDGTGTLAFTIKEFYSCWNPNTSQNSYVGSEETSVELDENETIYGSNAKNAGGYSSSHIRATLIGENEKTNRGYAGDVNLTVDNCLYSCIQSELQDVIVPKKVRYVTGNHYTEGSYFLNEDIVDSIWLFSDREIRGTGIYSGNTLEGLGDDGVSYAKFENPQSKNYIETYDVEVNTNRLMYFETGAITSCWLRSIALHTTYLSRSLFSSGCVNHHRAYLNLGLSFGFCIR